MNKRIQAIRKAAKLTQEEFAGKLMVKRNTVATWEGGRSVPQDSVVALICKEFDVSEAWLRTGAGEMYNKNAADDEIARFVDAVLSDEPESFRRRLVTAMSRLSPEGWKKLEAVALELLEEFKAQTPPPETIEEKAARLEQENVSLRQKLSAQPEPERVFTLPAIVLDEPPRSIGLAQPETPETFRVKLQISPMAAGYGEIAGDGESEYIDLKRRPPRGTSYIARVLGNSMEPVYYDGDLLFIKAQPDLRRGEIGVFFMGGKQYLKRLGDGELLSLNPEYEPIPIEEDIRCQGKVLGICDDTYK